jgi:putative flippase GtrA
MLKSSIHQLLKYFYPLVKNILSYEVYAYLTTGAINTFLNIGLFILLYNALINTVFAIEFATIISFIITVITGFWLQKNFAFKSASNTKKENQQQFGKYTLVALQGQFSAYLLTKLMVVVMLLPGSVAYIITAIIMLTINYFLQKYFTFKNKQLPNA